jgi:hypothetical protein
MSVHALLNWIQHTSWATGLKESALMFPLVEGSHILSLSISVGMIVVLDLRLLRLAFRDQPVSLIFEQVMPWVTIGFCAMFFTGILLFSAEAVSAWANSFFRAKMILLALLGINALYYRLRYYTGMAEWDRIAVPAGARIIAALSLIFWIGVIACGRTMAYEM